MELFDSAVGKKATLNYIGCKMVGIIGQTVWINGELNYKVRFPDYDIKKSGRKKLYYWEAIYPNDYVVLLN